MWSTKMFPMSRGGGRQLLDGVRHLPIPSGARSVEMKLQHTRARQAKMLIQEGLSTWSTLRPTTRTSLCSGCTVSTIIRAADRRPGTEMLRSHPHSTYQQAGCELQHEGDCGLLGPPRQADHGKNPNPKFQRASPHEQEERDGWS